MCFSASANLLPIILPLKPSQVFSVQLKVIYIRLRILNPSSQLQHQDIFLLLIQSISLCNSAPLELQLRKEITMFQEKEVESQCCSFKAASMKNSIFLLQSQEKKFKS
jgi:hypothetical protein